MTRRMLLFMVLQALTGAIYSSTTVSHSPTSTGSIIRTLPFQTAPIKTMAPTSTTAPTAPISTMTPTSTTTKTAPISTMAPTSTTSPEGVSESSSGTSASTHDCGQGEDASVICEGNNTTVMPPVRLVGSGNRCSGRVEVYRNNSWGTVCHDSWDKNASQVVCQQLSCGNAALTLYNAAFGPGSGPIWPGKVQCSGNESSITECPHLGVNSDECGHDEDISIICEEDFRNATVTSPVRLANSSDRCSGRVEVYLHSSWGTVCDNSWGMSDANVVCRQLGCGNALHHSAKFGPGSGAIWMDELQCLGNESSIVECDHVRVQHHDCVHEQDAGVTCEGAMSHAESMISTVRLVGSDSRCAGRVEVLLNGQWVPVCDDYWTINDAQVVCRQLDCGDAIGTPHFAPYGEGSGLIWLDRVECSGNESSIMDCEHSFGHHDYCYWDDASTVCEGDSTSPSIAIDGVRLAQADTNCSGRVEVLFRGEWGSVCGTSWDMNDAQVVCRQLGCGRALFSSSYNPFGGPRVPVWMHGVRCSGTESSIAYCPSYGTGSFYCGYRKDASVVCEDHRTLIQAAKIRCTSYQMIVTVPLGTLVSSGLNTSTGHLADFRCSYHLRYSFSLRYRVSIWASTCGTILTTNSTHVIYFNSLYFYPIMADSSAEPEVLPFSCAYPLETYASVVAARPVPLPNGLSGSGPAPVASMSLRRYSLFGPIYPPGLVTLRPGSPLYVQVSVRNTNGLVVVLGECYTTHSPRNDSAVHYVLIRDGCPVESHRVRVTGDGYSSSASFTVLSLPNLENNPYIFLHCKVRLCDDSEYSCHSYCPRRVARSLSSEAELACVTIGPITWMG